MDSINYSLTRIFLILKNLFKFGHLAPEKVNKYQKTIRDVEWESIVKYIPLNSKFLDVGCGTGYILKKAFIERDCDIIGIDPSPYSAGVDRKLNNDTKIEDDIKILKGYGEKMSFTSKSFDVVYLSHVFEHVNDQNQFLKEIKRVLKDDGILIIGMPTSTMAWLHLISSIMFTTHIRIIKYMFGKFNIIKNAHNLKFIHMIFPPSHSNNTKTVWFDIKHYKVGNWAKIISTEFKVVNTIFPALYPYPDYIQLFKLKKSSKRSSSVFFVCKKYAV